MLNWRRTLAAAATIALTVGVATTWTQAPAQPAQAGAAQGRGRGQQAPAPPDKPAPAVTVTGGQTAGGIYGDLAIYRGIPFAAPPVGDLRWRAPQPVVPWQGVREGVNFGGTCAQSEDCLFVNVYKPAGAAPNAKLPVMVWIYGGAFTSGASNNYEGPNFAKKGIVYVSMNYRLGRAGWFSHPAITKNAPKDESVSNYGLQDQIAALQWVQKNVGAFGGDNSNVTVFGESAGGISVNYLMILPETKGLFQKAISESGFGRSDPAALARSEAAGAGFFSNLGISGDSADTLKAMRAVPFEQLAGGLGLGAAGPIQDGKLVKMGTADAFTKGLESKVPYMLGGNSNEASLFPTQNPVARLENIKSTAGGIGAYEAAGMGDPERTVNLMVTDQYIGEPDRLLARAHVKNGQTVYRYHFSYVTPAQRSGLGLAHGGEIGFVFGRSLNTPEDTVISTAANAYWAAFGKTGNPGTAGGPTWPKYDAKAEPVLEFGIDGIGVRNGFHNDRLDWMEAHREQVIASGAVGGGTPVGIGNTGRRGAPPAGTSTPASSTPGAAR
jgi:para-nitrobenzyl esterase